jgi:hypothetical protein
LKNTFSTIFNAIKENKRIFLASLGGSLALFLIVLLLAIPSETAENELSPAFGKNVNFQPALEVPLPEEYEPKEYETLPEGHILSVLTGLPIYEGFAARRPLAVVVNNIRQALPQHGIASADIIYEVLAEGDITRLVAIFQSYWPETIGSIRSARDYFIDFAFNHDAIFVFHGTSPTGQTRIRNTRLDNLDGGHLEGRGVFWRDRTYPYWAQNTGQRPTVHSAFTGGSRIEQQIEAASIRDYMYQHPALGFNFGTPEAANLGPAHHITVPFSPNYTRRFIFDEEHNLYRVYNPRGALLDGNTREHVAVSNILIQFTNMHIIAGDPEGRRSVRTTGEGHGLLITNGYHFPVYWEKESHTAPTHWSFEDGSPLVLSAGTTWICVFQGNVIIE